MMKELKIGNIIKDENNNFYQLLWFTKDNKDEIYELMRLKNSTIAKLYSLDEFYYIAESLEEYKNMQNKLKEDNISKEKYATLQQINIKDILEIKNMHYDQIKNMVEIGTNEQISEGTDNYINKYLDKESNNYPDRYDGDKCMIAIEEFPVKNANGNSTGAMFCIGSIIKYLWRLERKGNPLDQIDKIEWYLKRLRSYYIENEQTKINEQELRK